MGKKLEKVDDVTRRMEKNADVKEVEKVDDGEVEGEDGVSGRT